MHNAKEANRLTKMAAERILDAQCSAINEKITEAIRQGSYRIFVDAKEMPDSLMDHMKADGYTIGPSGHGYNARWLVSWEKVDEVSEKEAADGLGHLFG